MDSETQEASLNRVFKTEPLALCFYLELRERVERGRHTELLNQDREACFYFYFLPTVKKSVFNMNANWKNSLFTWLAPNTQGALLFSKHLSYLSPACSSALSAHPFPHLKLPSVSSFSLLPQDLSLTHQWYLLVSGSIDTPRGRPKSKDLTLGSNVCEN